jgi:hypothetical protein
LLICLTCAKGRLSLRQAGLTLFFLAKFVGVVALTVVRLSNKEVPATALVVVVYGELKGRK